MMLALINHANRLPRWINGEEGQDLVEYALIIALIALACTATMNTLASDISSAFSSLGSAISSDI
jgi:pilus assembly protein Flp/PilA